MTVFRWANPSAAQIEEAKALADSLGEPPYWEGDTLCVGQCDPESKPNVPEAVTARQARLALLAAGHLDTVESALDTIPGAEGRAARIEWEYALEIRRDSPMVETLARILGMTEEYVDDLFRAAQKL